MYTLYALPGTCSLGIHVLLNALNQQVEYINVKDIENFKQINPVGTVPVLKDGDTLIREGGAIVLYLLKKHQSPMLPEPLGDKAQFLQKLFFNYATLHPAYSKMFFAMNNLSGESQQQAYEASAKAISSLWHVIDKQLDQAPYLHGDKPSILDYLICVYANWGTFFNVQITLGKNVERLIKEVILLPEFQNALKVEGIEYGLFAE